MQCYTELLPPSGVTHAISLPFISANSNNLIVAKTSLLQIYSLINVAYGTPIFQADDKGKIERQQYTKLVLVAEYDLPGTVAGLDRIKILDSKSGGEALLVATRNAKLSLIEWDHERNGITTISIHFYEREDVHKNPWTPDLRDCATVLAVDPSSRCAVLNFGIHSLAILPFHQTGDDLVMDDYDHGEDEEKMDTMVKESGEDAATSYKTPYGPSFVLPMTALDPTLAHPINLAFLYEYREPTFGILYSQVATSSSLMHERKDVVHYAVFTLDLQQRASTTLITVSRLPSDLWKIVPLPPPVGGALLIGLNELVHVDQAGKTNAVGVNEFARQASSFSMADQSGLELRLEGCVVEQMGTDNGDLALALSDGRMAVFRFKVDGRSVSGISVQLIPEQAGGSVLKARASCSAPIGRGKIFLGSEEGDSILVGGTKPSQAPKKPEAEISDDHTAEHSDAEEEDDDDMYEDDLYSTPLNPAIPSQNRTATNGISADDFVFRPHDRLWNLGPLKDITLGRPSGSRDKNKRQNNTSISPDLELVVSQGRDRAGGLAVLRREIDPYVIDSLKMEDVHGVWSIQVGDTNSADAHSIPQPRKHDRFLVFSKKKEPGKEDSVVYTVDSNGLDEIKAPEFNPNEDCTIDVGTLANGTRVVQVLRSEVRSYESDLGLAQIYPVYDEDTSEERTVVQASFAEPYLLALRDDQSLLVLQADKSGDLDEVPLGESVGIHKWVSGCLYQDKYNTFIPDKGADKPASPNILLFLLRADHSLFIFSLPNLSEPLYSVEGVGFLPPILSCEPPPRRQTFRDSLCEILVADLGDSISRHPYLILRTKNNELTIYEPFHPNHQSDKLDLKFLKIANYSLPKSKIQPDRDEESDNSHQPLRAIHDLCGYKTVFMPGSSPCFIIKSSTSSPHIIGLRGKPVHSLSSFHIPACEKGFAYIDADNIVRMCRFPGNTRFDSSWTTRKIPLGEQVDFVEYCAKPEVYVLGTSHKVDFKLPDDDEVHTEWRNEVISLMPQHDRGAVKLMDPRTWSVVDSHWLGEAETVMCIKTISMEVSEVTHEMKDLVVVGTAIVRGIDIAPRGSIYIFEVIDVVPEPGHPETSRRLKLITKEDVKGAVTSVSGIGGQGFLIAAQGQKCIVRGLKEDASLLPVAFMDMQCYVSVLKELKGTGMCIMGDALKGLWFTGYSEEPYKLMLFGKGSDELQVLAADFLPDGKSLFILAADDDCNIHILEYDPEDPTSSKGDQLLHRSIFHTGHFTSTLTLLPQVPSSSPQERDENDMEVEDPPTKYQVLVTSQEGSIGLVTPMTEDAYRRLWALQSQLVTSLEHPCGLNPRAYRAIESDGIGGRGMIDGNLLLRWLDLGAQRKAEIASRVGADVEGIRGDLEMLGGGLGFL